MLVTESKKNSYLLKRLHRDQTGSAIVEASLVILPMLMGLFALFMLGLFSVYCADSASYATRAFLNYHAVARNNAITSVSMDNFVLHPEPGVKTAIAQQLNNGNYLDPARVSHVHILNVLAGEVSRDLGRFLRDPLNRVKQEYTHVEVVYHADSALNEVTVYTENPGIANFKAASTIFVRENPGDISSVVTGGGGGGAVGDDLSDGGVANP